jgi:hypothetical protein
MASADRRAKPDGLVVFSSRQIARPADAAGRPNLRCCVLYRNHDRYGSPHHSQKIVGFNDHSPSREKLIKLEFVVLPVLGP